MSLRNAPVARLSYALVATVLLALAGPAAAQSIINVSQETAAGSDVFGTPFTIQAFDGDGLSAADYYRYNTDVVNSFAGPDGTFGPDARRYGNLSLVRANVFFVDAADGLAMFIIIPKFGGSSTTFTLVNNETSGGAFDTDIVEDDPSDPYVFGASNTTLTFSGTITTDGRTDGVAARFTTANPVVETEFNNVSNLTGWRFHSSGTDGATVEGGGTTSYTNVNGTEVGRAFRLGFVGRQVEQTALFNPSNADSDGAGWRLLSTPVRDVTVGDLAALNLVQGVPAGNGDSQPQYPTATANIYTSYQGSGQSDYDAPTATGDVVNPGEGFFWYFYDQDIDPPDATAGGGTSQSVELTGFSLTATGTPLVTDVTRSFTDNAGAGDDDFYMIGNPFAAPFSVDAISATGGTLQDGFSAWDPGTSSYQVLFASPLGGGAADVAAVWQGLLAEVTSPTAGTIDFTMMASGMESGADPTFYGRQSAEAFAQFELSGTTASSASTYDAAAYVRYRSDAGRGWDRYDLSKPIPPTSSYALIAPMGERDGQGYPQSILSLPENHTAAVPLGFMANEAGTFTLSWSGTLADAGGFVLVDLVTDETVDLSTGGSYTFSSEASDWTTRFELRSNTSVAAEDDPAGLYVGSPFPNPTAGTAQMDVRLPEAGDLAIFIFDALGRIVARTEVATLAPGVVHSITLPTADLAPGVYAVRVTGSSVGTARALTVVR